MMIPHFTASNSLDELKTLLDNVIVHSNPDGLIILGCVDNHFDDDNADAFFRQLNIPVGGGLFPAVIHDQQVHESGWLVYAVIGELSVTLSDNLSLNDQSAKVLSSAAALLSSDAEVSLVIVDGHSSSISSFLTQVYDGSSVSAKFFGGGPVASLLARGAVLLPTRDYCVMLRWSYALQGAVASVSRTVGVLVRRYSEQPRPMATQ